MANRYFQDPQAIDGVWADEQFNAGTFDKTAWSLGDNLGTIRDVVVYNAGTNTTTVVNHLKYDAFGNITSETDASETPRQSYTGRELDEELGLYYYRARYYDPRLGRFIGEDPIGHVAGDPNLTRYVFNVPVTRTDPLGLITISYGWAFDLGWGPITHHIDLSLFLGLDPTTGNVSFAGGPTYGSEHILAGRTSLELGGGLSQVCTITNAREVGHLEGTTHTGGVDLVYGGAEYVYADPVDDPDPTNAYQGVSASGLGPSLTAGIHGGTHRPICGLTLVRYLFLESSRGFGNRTGIRKSSKTG